MRHLRLATTAAATLCVLTALPVNAGAVVSHRPASPCVALNPVAGATERSGTFTFPHAKVGDYLTIPYLDDTVRGTQTVTIDSFTPLGPSAGVALVLTRQYPTPKGFAAHEVTKDPIPYPQFGLGSKITHFATTASAKTSKELSQFQAFTWHLTHSGTFTFTGVTVAYRVGATKCTATFHFDDKVTVR